jgi:nucleotide-binding universal stress UspA family protein
MKYLFCTDGSESSFSALGKALSLVKNGFTVDVFYLKEEKNIFTKLYNMILGKKTVCKKDQKEGEEVLEKSRLIIEKNSHFLGKYFFECGSVKNVIKHIKENFYNMAILGSHNYIGVQNQLLSFSRKILENTDSPVFICRGVDNGEDLKEKKHFLLCIDESYQTFNAVISCMKNFNTENDISLITVTPSFSQYSSETSLHSLSLEGYLEKEILLADQKLDEIERILCHNRISVKSKIHLRGNPPEEILEFVKQDFDLLVLGSHARKGLIDFLFGSVSKKILDYATLPILIIPTQSSS